MTNAYVYLTNQAPIEITDLEINGNISVGILTATKVGIGTTNPIGSLQVGVGSSIFVVTGIGSVGIGTAIPESNFQIVTTGAVQQLLEKTNISSTALTGTINIDVLSGTLYYYTTNASANWTFNIRGDSATSLNSMLPIGKSVTVTILSTQGATAYYADVFKIDGTTITPKWMNGVTPSGGYTSSINIYTYAIIKTGDAAFTVIGSLNRTT